MIWYGAIFFSFLLVILLSLCVFWAKVIFSFSFNKFLLWIKISQLMLNLYLFFFCISLISIYFILEFTIEINSLTFILPSSINIYDYSTFSTLFHLTNLNLLTIYYFPFMYIFLLITILSIFFCLSYNINEIVMFSFYCTIILIFGYLLFFTDSLIIFFLAYEMLLVPSFFILYKFAKTRRCVEAAYLMFFWTQFGALFLIFSFIYLFFITNSTSFTKISAFNFSSFEVNFLFVCWIVGFGVKLPIWPFYGWLPKAHVEASTNFSIFLSGVLVKFAFFGLLKCLLTIQLEPTFYYVYPFLTIGLTDAAFKLFYQIDLKKLVAYSTVVEMHWLTMCVISGQSPLMLASFCMLISHALLSTNSFLLVDAINRRFKTRLITEISGLNFICPKLFLIVLINCLVFLGFPGTIFFIAEFLFFSFFFDLFPELTLWLLVLLYLLVPIFFFRTWVNVMFGFSEANSLRLIPDLSSKELLIFVSLLFLMIWLGFSWQSFIF